ncbi:MAG TPA: SDR family oxidoreductase [Polyangiaceae bacterium]|jgi:NAD(P)-dependent dehydrogenase (short-subunit alcohol dehydrogenase family)
MADLSGKTILITGANQGIGKASALALGKMGAKLVLVCRSADKGREAVADLERGGVKGIELIVADMGKQADVRRAAAEFKAKHDRLDVLLNNAGVLCTSRRETVDGLEETFAINHMGYFLFTNLLLDVLKKSAPARIVNVASHAHKGAKVAWDDPQLKQGWSAIKAYGQSKLCNILFTRELSRRLEGTGVTANSLHPGVIGSGFGHTDGGFFAVLVSIAKPFMLTPEKGARTQVWLASSPEVQGITGKYFDKCKESTPSPEALDADAPARLWALSEKLAETAKQTAAA